MVAFPIHSVLYFSVLRVCKHTFNYYNCTFNAAHFQIITKQKIVSNTCNYNNKVMVHDISLAGCKPELQMMYAGSKLHLVNKGQFTKVSF